MASEDKPKIFEDARDITLTVGVILIMMFLAVGATGLCSINPEKPGPVQNVDAATFLEMEARGSGAVIREPVMPEGWQPTAARRKEMGGESGAVVSWLTAEEGYVESAQTQLALGDVPSAYDSNYRGNSERREVAGHDVEILSSDDKDVRPLWITDLGDARLVLTGSASDADYETALTAFTEAEPLQIAEDGSVVSG
ncbi:DUF4245 domain-containing protein [Corynebacterium sp. B5-R-101]|uniref:DUF4245 domain-containing protein n=1 Tax=Corynebacterium intestinale TaxID=2943492 RepID=A0ABT0T6T5_9CORY|nr:DUF4245 domain-containing protein [Corynebacterium intestinale]MCP1388913.1 DUF4245 domain-containing protein [Corynebacterium intestinale]